MPFLPSLVLIAVFAHFGQERLLNPEQLQVLQFSKSCCVSCNLCVCRIRDPLAASTCQRCRQPLSYSPQYVLRAPNAHCVSCARPIPESEGCYSCETCPLQLCRACAMRPYNY